MLSGSKTWRLHKEVDGFKLPSQPSGNLTQDAAGKPICEVTLQVGDVLYLPRGTVHQAVAQDEASVHLTISTYQKWTWGDLVLTMMQHALQVNLVPLVCYEWLKTENNCILMMQQVVCNPPYGLATILFHQMCVTLWLEQFSYSQGKNCVG